MAHQELGGFENEEPELLASMTYWGPVGNKGI